VGTKDARRRGYIEARPNGTFRAVVFAGTDALTDRDRYIKRTAPTRREGEKLLAKLQNEVDERRHSQASITLTQAMDQWLEVARHEASTRERYDELIRLYLTPVLGKRQLVEIDPQTLERLYSRLRDCRRSGLRDRGMSAADRRRRLGAICGAGRARRRRVWRRRSESTSAPPIR
jgi:hypothetical protein